MAPFAAHRHPATASAVVRAFRADRSGASAIEFAILSSAFFMMLFMMLQVAFVLLQQHLLDNATAIAVRSLVLGSVQTGDTQLVADFKQKYVCPNLVGLFDCSRVIADVRVTQNSEPNFNPSAWSSLPVTGQADAGYCVGSAGEYMFMRIAYPAPLIGAEILPESVFTTFKGERVAMLQSFGALRIEPVGVKRVGTC